jgi:branched-chain amino acid transport system substrate-binding protein
MVLTVGVTTIQSAPQKTNDLPDEILVGGVFPIVKRPEAGRDRRDAFLIAIEEINSQTGADRILPTGINLTALVKDDDNSAPGGKFAAETLISEGVHVVIGSSGSSVSAAIAAELTPHKIAQLSYASSSPTLSDRDTYPYFMRNVASDADQGVALADLVDAMGWTKGATINTADSYGTGLITVFTTVFEDRDGTITTSQEFETGASDVSTQVQAIKDSDPEFVIANMIDKDGKILFKKAKELGLTKGGANAISWVITDGTSTTATFEADQTIEDAMQGFIGTTPAPLLGVGYQAFNDTWFDPDWASLPGPAVSQTTGVAFNSYAPFSYDAVYVMAKALAAAKSTDGDAVIEELMKTDHEGASGRIKFNALGELNGRFGYVTLEGDTYKTFGVWEGTGTGNATAVPTLTLPDGTTESVSGLKFPAKYDYVPAADGATPGFTIISLFGAFAVIVLINKRRKK